MKAYKEAQLNYFIKNQACLLTDEFDSYFTPVSPLVYEVIRVISNVPIFVKEHLERLQNSLKLLNSTYEISNHMIIDSIHRLIKLNGNVDQNIKIVVNALEKPLPDVYLYYIDSKYPNALEYSKGVPTILYHSQRHNPNAKVMVKEQREAINKELYEKNAYEALLINDQSNITEGSRSNIFLVKDSVVYTAPSAEVLEGITRGKIIGLCKKHSINIVEQSISKDFLQEIDGLFLTGTSPKVLPIAMVESYKYDSSNNPVIKKIIKHYDKMIDNYIAEYL